MNNNLFFDADSAYEAGDFKKAFEIFMQLAELEDADAMSRIALMYAEGEGVPKNMNASIEWDKKAIEAGSISSISNLAISYRMMGDILNSKRFFEKAIAAGDDDAALELAKLYMVSDLERDKVIKLLNLVASSQRVSDDNKEQAINFLGSLN